MLLKPRLLTASYSRAIKNVLAILVFANLLGCEQNSQAGRGAASESFEEQLAEFGKSRELGDQYSTEPQSITLTGTNVTFVVPRNFFTAYGTAYQSAKDLRSFGFTLFLPDFIGYTRKTASLVSQMAPTEEMVRVTEVSELSKRLYIISENRHIPASPTAWGDPQALFDLHKPRNPETKRKEYGLDCEGWRVEPGSTAVCIGTRSNGEKIYLRLSDTTEFLAGEATVIYASEREGLFVRYRYWRKHLHNWRQIDDAVWAKLHAWRSAPARK